MHKFQDSKTLNYSNEQLYSIVIDVEKYDEFVPWCKSCTIVSKSEGEIIADIYIKSGFVSKSYRSFIKHGKRGGEYFINISQISGPFDYLNTDWNFISESTSSTLVQFNIDFKFKSDLLNLLIGGVFDYASKEMISAFEKRAKELYGKS